MHSFLWPARENLWPTIDEIVGMGSLLVGRAALATAQVAPSERDYLEAVKGRAEASVWMHVPQCSITSFPSWEVLRQHTSWSVFLATFSNIEIEIQVSSVCAGAACSWFHLVLASSGACTACDPLCRGHHSMSYRHTTARLAMWS